MGNKILSVVIPTLQRKKEILYKLINSLTEEECVGEIIIIDNSLRGIDLENKKLRVVIPKENLYVNPSWNLGVEIAKNDIIALMNDDISIPKNFCRDVVNQMNHNMGIVGVNSANYILALEEINTQPMNTNPVLKKTNYMDYYYGTAMFFYKEAYSKIPDEIKIVYGDVWIFEQAKKARRINYKIENQIIYHIGSLSSSDKRVSPICKNDAKIFKQKFVKWYNRLFSYEYLWDGFKVRFLGITIKFKNRKAKGYCNE